MLKRTTTTACAAILLLSLEAGAATPWLLGQATKIPTQYTNQESGYFSIVEGKNGRLYIGAAKYGVNAYLIEFDPKMAKMTMVVSPSGESRL